jgi:ubiquinone biosynthesis protein
MSRIEGVKVTDWSGDGPSRRRLAESVICALLAVPMLSLEDSAEFHADPHAGNLFATTDGRLAILDWSLTGSLGRSARSAVARMALGAAMFDSGKITAELKGLCENAPDEAGIRRVVESALDRAALVMTPGPTWLMHLMDEAARAGACFSADLMLFRKTLFTLEGVIEDIAADVRIDDVLLRMMGAAFAAELSQRGFARPESREFGTHLSNLDLAAAMWASPQAAVNRWARVWRACWS